MSKKMWGGRFKKKTDPLVEEFTRSIDCDRKLAAADVLGSRIHVEVLFLSGYLTNSEYKALNAALDKIKVDINNGSFKIDPSAEDIHTNIQDAVEKSVGSLVMKMHTARSRNDQVLFDLKWFCLNELALIAELCSKLQDAFKRTAAKVHGIIVPGYTHLQHAQLVYLSDHLAAYADMIARDTTRIVNAGRTITFSLGAGALAGTPIKKKTYIDALKSHIDVKTTAWEFFKPVLTAPKALDTVSDRDFVMETLSAAAIIGMHLSRLSEELIIWSSAEFGFLELDDAYATGSSLMPQKKNADVLELIRGYTGTLYGNLVSGLTMMKGLPLTYNRDMQLDKPPLFSSLEIVEKELKVLPGLLESIIWKKDAIARTVRDDETLYATDFVYYLVGKKVPFKEAHDAVGRLVSHALDTKKKIRDMPDAELKKFNEGFVSADLEALMDPDISVRSRISVKR